MAVKKLRVSLKHMAAPSADKHTPSLAPTQTKTNSASCFHMVMLLHLLTRLLIRAVCSAAGGGVVGM